MSVEIIRRSCPTCEACCGLQVHVDREAKQIVRIEGDPDDFRSRGYLCPKAYAMKAVYEDPDRLTPPMRKRADGRFEEISWDEAFAYAAERLRPIREKYGPQAVGVFIGEPTGHNLGALLYTTLFMRALETPRAFSSATMDQFPKNVTLKLMYGDGWMFVIPDVKRTDLFICMGGNPVVSQGSLMGTPDVPGVLTRDPQARRPRDRDRSAPDRDRRARRRAPLHPARHRRLLPRRDDPRLLRRGAREASAASPTFTDGVDEVRELCREFTPEAVAETTGIPAATIRAARPRVRDDEEGRPLRPHRHLHPGVRDPRELARSTSPAILTGPFRRGRLHDVPAAGGGSIRARRGERPDVGRRLSHDRRAGSPRSTASSRRA